MAVQRLTGLLLTLAGVTALFIAWYVQHILQIVPCELCLVERGPWRIVFMLGIMGFIIPNRAGYWAIALSLPVLAAGVALAVLHLGVEWHWWQSPFPSCQAPVFHPGSLRERLASMPSRPAKPCDAATYLFGFPLSMAALNGLFTLAVAGVTALALRYHHSLCQSSPERA